VKAKRDKQKEEAEKVKGNSGDPGAILKEFAIGSTGGSVTIIGQNQLRDDRLASLQMKAVSL